MNQTVTYGDIATFECRISGCVSSLRLLVNDMTIAPNATIQGLDRREYKVTIDYCPQNTNYTVANFWFFVNNRTLTAVEYISCKIDSDIVSTKAYITSDPKCPESPTIILERDASEIFNTGAVNSANKETIKFFSGLYCVFICLYTLR